MLTVRDLHKTFASQSGRTPVLRGLSMQVQAGQTLALTGESGSGKSTLLTLLAGLDQPDSGEICLNGADLTQMDDTGRAALRRSDVGLVFQQFNLIPSFTVQQNLAFHARLGGRDDPKRVSALAERLGLTAHLQKYPENLSGGQQQRVAIGRTLALAPKLVLADEPTGNLDEDTAAEVLRIMLEMVSETGAALIMVTHSQALAGQLQRRLHLSHGLLQA